MQIKNAKHKAIQINKVNAPHAFLITEDEKYVLILKTGNIKLTKNNYYLMKFIVDKNFDSVKSFLKDIIDGQIEILQENEHNVDFLKERIKLLSEPGNFSEEFTNELYNDYATAYEILKLITKEQIETLWNDVKKEGEKYES